jgi:CII-binding regulator of phage lambda lysogenization HflD
MHIPKEFLEEKNYEGSRLIEITDERVAKLHKELKKLDEEVEPFRKEMERQSPELDALYAKLTPLEEQRAKLKEELETLLIPYRVEMEKADKVYQKAQLIKNKITPIVNELVKPELKEFELAKEMVERNGKIYVEVIDELEEKIKAIRAQKK